MSAIALGNPLSKIERALGVGCGVVSGFLLRDRTIALRYSIALVEAANIPDAQAGKLLEASRGKNVKDRIARSLLNQANALRARAEADRRLSETIGRKAHDLIGEREKVGARAAAAEAKARAYAEAGAQRSAILGSPLPRGFKLAPLPEPAATARPAETIDIAAASPVGIPRDIAMLMVAQPPTLPPAGMSMAEHALSVERWLSRAIEVYERHGRDDEAADYREAHAGVVRFLDDEDRRAGADTEEEEIDD